MIHTLETRIVKDPSAKKLIVTRDFNAPLEKVWKAWTDSSVLDSWWAPRPWKAETKLMDFREGGIWLYAMVSPQGEKHWCKLEYRVIKPQQSITLINTMCDETGRTNGMLPVMDWVLEFRTQDAGTAIRVEITFDNEADLQAVVDRGFKEGFTAGLRNLDEVLG